jgi:pilus assembly protein Flp/PilA
MLRPLDRLLNFITGRLSMKALNMFLNDESGQDLIEYALVAALVGLGAVAAMKTLGTSITNAFTSVGTTLTTNV